MSQTFCPACGEREFEKRESIDVAEQHKHYAPDDEEAQQNLTAAALETALSYRMLRCRRCGLEFCEPLRAPSAAWYQIHYRGPGGRTFERWDFDEVLRRIPKSGRVFEFGSGWGPFLALCREHGVPASGMDLSEDGIASCLAKGLTVQRIDLDEAAAAANSDRVPQLAAFHFLEHLERPSALFDHAAARALPDSHLWVSVPSDRRAFRRLGGTDILDQPPHHMTRWTAEAFREIGKRHGWRLVETLYEPVSLRTALWFITVHTPAYRRLNAAGRFQNRFVERAYRASALPAALIRRLSSQRQLSGFSMLAHFTRDARSEEPNNY